MPRRLHSGGNWLWSEPLSKASLERAELNLEAAATLAPQDAQVKSELAKVRGKRR